MCSSTNFSNSIMCKRLFSRVAASFQCIQAATTIAIVGPPHGGNAAAAIVQTFSLFLSSPLCTFVCILPHPPSVIIVQIRGDNQSGCRVALCHSLSPTECFLWRLTLLVSAASLMTSSFTHQYLASPPVSEPRACQPPTASD